MHTKLLLKNLKGSPRHKWKNNLTGSEGVHRIQVAQDTVQWQALVKTVMNLQIP
jgi:hypothetical protein